MFKINNKKKPPEVFYKKAVLKYFSIITGKYLCWSLFLIKLRVFRSATLLKRYFNTGVFLWILRNFEKCLSWRKSVNGCFWIISSQFFDSFIWRCSYKCFSTFAIKHLCQSVFFNKHCCRPWVVYLYSKRSSSIGIFLEFIWNV